MPGGKSNNGYMTDDYRGGDQFESTWLETILHIVFFPFYLIVKIFGG